jgi:hypothetical protein
MTERVVIDRAEMDRFLLMRMELDRYEAQLIPDLQQEAVALRHALRKLVDAIQDAERTPHLGSNVSNHAAVREAQRLLAET